MVLYSKAPLNINKLFIQHGLFDPTLRFVTPPFLWRFMLLLLVWLLSPIA
jgi:hypothetical protein